MVRTPTTRMNAGGRATEAGMDFQAEVGTWLAAHLLARVPVGGRFGLGNTALPTSIQLETGDGLDDIRLEQDDASRIDLQSPDNSLAVVAVKPGSSYRVRKREFSMENIRPFPV